MSERLTTKADGFEILPFQSANLARAQFLLTGTMTRVDGDGRRGSARCRSSSRSPT